MTTALKTRTKKIETLYPPKEIRENTKARRAWVEAKVAEINLLPERSAKSVGTGSYQSVSVYSVITTEGRERLRGICQVCGNAQVVDGGKLVFHGYKRPGDGYTIGQCPGAGEEPLNVTDELTNRYLTLANARADRLGRALIAAQARHRDASRALYPAGG